MRVGIVIFDDVEVLDFAGPFEVFSVTGRRNGSNPFDVFTVSETGSAVKARNNLVITPTHSFANCPQTEVFVVPGGYATGREMLNEKMLEFVKSQAETAKVVLSVCTGALILGRTGLLDGMRVTTHHGAVEELRIAAPAALIHAHERVIDNAK